MRTHTTLSVGLITVRFQHKTLNCYISDCVNCTNVFEVGNYGGIRDCDEVIMGTGQDEVNQEESEQNEVDGIKKGADSTGEVMHM